MQNEETNPRVVTVQHGISQKPDILSLAQTIHTFLDIKVSEVHFT